jgi:hypothetical protein
MSWTFLVWGLMGVGGGCGVGVREGLGRFGVGRCRCRQACAQTTRGSLQKLTHTHTYTHTYTSTHSPLSFSPIPRPPYRQARPHIPPPPPSPPHPLNQTTTNRPAVEVVGQLGVYVEEHRHVHRLAGAQALLLEAEALDLVKVVGGLVWGGWIGSLGFGFSWGVRGVERGRGAEARDLVEVEGGLLGVGGWGFGELGWREGVRGGGGGIRWGGVNGGMRVRVWGATAGCQSPRVGVRARRRFIKGQAGHRVPFPNTTAGCGACRAAVWGRKACPCGPTLSGTTLYVDTPVMGLSLGRGKVGRGGVFGGGSTPGWEGRARDARLRARAGPNRRRAGPSWPRGWPPATHVAPRPTRRCPPPTVPPSQGAPCIPPPPPRAPHLLFSAVKKTSVLSPGRTLTNSWADEQGPTGEG